ncbi:MAG: TetR/AcrR family transcriptional regulator [Solirubrobacterales bacterium]|jgi:AcrR family transcriptional regulator|nr:TetR/AcrR family transcriptional regulator [Solirubrobacterales bacterium]
MPRTPPEKPTKRVYLHREARRQQIVDAARPLFAAKPITQITVADIAQAAGVSRSLIQNYFGTITDVFMAVLAQSSAAQVDARSVTAPTPLKKRLEINVPASLDVVKAHSEIWYAVMGHAHTSGNAQVDAVRNLINETNIERTLEVHNDLLTDTPATRVALRALMALWVETTRAYLDDEITRPQAEAYIKAANYAIVKTAIPAMEKA